MVDFWTNKSVLVTGCTGFLGSHLVSALLEKKANVTGLVRDIPKGFDTEYLPKGINVVFGDVCDYALMQRILTDYAIEIVFHLAAQAIVTTANENPIETFKSNIEGTWNILEASRQSKRVKAVVLASSDKAYGEPIYEPYDEAHPLQGSHPYDVSKSCADLLGKTYHNTYQLPVSITRCGNLYGPGDLNFNRLIPGTIQSVLTNSPIIIRSDGQSKRDYLFVEDAVDGYLKIGQALYENPATAMAYNLSHGKSYSIIEIVEIIKDLADAQDAKVKILNTAKGEIKKQWLKSDRIIQSLGWKSTTDIQAGIGKTLNWYKTQIS